MLSGNKSCASCDTHVPVLEVLRVSMGSREVNCRKCGKPFLFSDTRKWVSIFTAVLVVFSPSSATVFLGYPVSAGMMLVIKYLVAMLLFYMINGRDPEQQP